MNGGAFLCPKKPCSVFYLQEILSFLRKVNKDRISRPRCIAKNSLRKQRKCLTPRLKLLMMPQKLT